MRTVIDVNVWISGLLWGGGPGEVLRLVYDRQLDSAVSAELLQELEVTLRRPKFQPRLVQRGQTVESLVAIAAALCPSVSIEEVEVPNLRDPNDAKIIATAIAAEADVLVTGDQDLLVLDPVQNIRILAPAEFLSLLDSNQ